jgi:thiol-disulfide isomerase/thioredoxin
MRNVFITYLILFLLILGCNSQIKERVTENNQESITLIFKDFPKENSIYRITQQKSIRSSSDINFVDDNLIHQKIFFNEKNQNDTVRILTQRNRVEVTLIYNGIESANYLFHKGDSVYFTYNQGTPNATVINRKFLNYEINYDVIQKAIIANDDIPAIRKYFSPLFFIKFDYRNNEKLKSYKDSCASVAKTQFVEELFFLDSLCNNGFISNEIYYLKRRSLLWPVYLMKGNIANYEDSLLTKLLSDTICYINPSDTLLCYNYYRSYLIKKVNNHFSNIKLINESNGSRPDFCAQFDTIYKLTFLTEREKKYLLTEKLRSIFETGNANEINIYKKKFRDITGDYELLNYLLKLYSIDLSTAEELLLLDVNNNKTNLNTLTASFNGKVLYIDFWASWCAPCRVSMPDANKLREEYKGKDVVFLYLALNDKEKDWKDAITDLGLNNNCENYFIINPKTSKMIEDLSVSSIPRYLLFDKKGNLVHKNAPGPSGDDIRKLLNGLLEQ